MSDVPEFNSPRVQFFDSAQSVETYYGNLPHWRQPDVAYFVTWRLADSLPQTVLDRWVRRKSSWLNCHGIDPSWQRDDPDRFRLAYASIPRADRSQFERDQRRILFAELNQGAGSCILRFQWLRRIVSDAMWFFHGKRVWLGDYVIMPNHVHAILIPFTHYALEDLIGSIKKWSARRIRKALRSMEEREKRLYHSRPRLWQRETYDHIIRDPNELQRCRNYIEENPRRARLHRDEYEYWRAAWLDNVW